MLEMKFGLMMQSLENIYLKLFSTTMFALSGPRAISKHKSMKVLASGENFPCNFLLSGFGDFLFDQGHWLSTTASESESGSSNITFSAEMQPKASLTMKSVVAGSSFSKSAEKNKSLHPWPSFCSISFSSGW